MEIMSSSLVFFSWLKAIRKGFALSCQVIVLTLGLLILWFALQYCRWQAENQQIDWPMLKKKCNVYTIRTCVAVWAMWSQASMIWSTAPVFLCRNAATFTTRERVSLVTLESTNSTRSSILISKLRGLLPFLKDTRLPKVHVALSIPEIVFIV